ncbi:MAG: hypothetical protein GTN35_04115 [Nitrososphaeria archaeon]|nr:hypothetical protein [Nitrosopumilaceae archaeon]NIP10205.1 hypothetical protein [Nitrosopumilaceae archaeon]NIP91569.1 hypothetical protein [Nitrososphaeria archaeon]NIS95404.1 hypothetical protein [Nitrosopumilaceae archaeon]
MNSKERELLDKLDKLVLESSGEDLKKIQEMDLETQLNGQSFYDEYLNSPTLVNQTIKQESNESKK